MSFRTHWQHVKQEAPGRRFESFYKLRQKERAKDGRWKGFLYVGLGIGIILSGVVFLAIPGPGLLVIAAGLALIAGESVTMARWLDKGELWARKTCRGLRQRWRRLQAWQRGVCIVMGCVLALGAGAWVVSLML